MVDLHRRRVTTTRSATALPPTPAPQPGWPLDLPAGDYDVQVTWNADTNHATNTPYVVKVNGTVVGTFTVNQLIAPTGTTVDGVAFQTLMTSVPVPAGGTLELDLAGTANGYVIADAARFVPSAAPTVDLNWSGGGLTGVPATEPVGIPFTVGRTFTIAGGTVSTNFTIGYYASTSSTFDSTAVLLATETIDASGGLAPGNYAGTSPLTPAPHSGGTYYLFARVDNDSAIHETNESNNVTACGRAPSPSPARSSTTSSPAIPRPARDGRATPAQGSTTRSATALPPTPAPLPGRPLDLPAGDYDVQVTWNADYNHATNTPYVVKVNGSVVGSFTVNQMIAPTGTTVDGVAFQTLMTSVPVPAGGTLELDLAGTANGYVIADAARFVPSTAPAVDLNWSGGGLTGVPATEPVGTPFTVGRTYTVAGGTVSTDFTIGYYASTSSTFDSSAVLLATESIDASGGLAPGNYAGTSPPLQLPTSGGTYYLFAFVDNDSAFPESNETNNVTAAAGPVTVAGTIIDDLQPGYSETGSGWSSYTGAGYDNEVRYRAATDPSTATWQATDLPAGDYDVQVTWNADSNHATNTPYVVKVNGTVVGTFTVNQMIAPTGTIVDGVAFQTLLTSVPVPAGGTLELDLAGSANGYVIADAARFVPGTAPTVATPAAASPSTVTGTSTILTVLGADANYPESHLTYTWSTTYAPSGATAPTFSVNGTNGAKDTTVSFLQAGTYIFLVTSTGPDSLMVTSSVTVTVDQALTAIVVAPGSADASARTRPSPSRRWPSTSSASALATPPAFTWSVDSGGVGGSVSTMGLYTAPASETGSDTVRAASGGVSGTATVFLAVFNGPPVARNEVYTAVHDQMLTIAAPGVLFNDTDPAGLPLTAVTERTVTTQQGGTVTLNADGSFSYTPRATFHGLDSFTYMVSNGGLESTSATVTINVTETAPVARADSYTIPEDDASNVAQESVLLNDTDADGDALTAQMASGAGSYPQHATHFDLSTNGTFIYKPTTGYFGSDSFTYEAFDGLEVSNPVTVTINVSNQRPTVQSASYTIPAVPTTIAAASGVLATATDPFGYPLTATEGTPPTHGSLTLNPDGSFTYTAVPGYTGPDSFTFTASDGVNTSDPATVLLDVLDQLPSAGPVQPDGSTYNYAVQPGGSTSWTAAAGLLSSASDPYGYSLTAVPDWSNSANGAPTTTNTDGSFVYTTGDGTLTVNADGSFTYNPASGVTSPVSFTYDVSDGVYTSLPVTVTINVDSTEQPMADTGPAYTYVVPPGQVLTTSSSDGVLSRASDPYGYSLTASLVSGPTNGTFALNSDGSFSYTPKAGVTLPDTEQFTYKAYDGLNYSDPTTVSLNVVDQAPTADTGPAYTYAVAPGGTLTTTAANGVLSRASDLYGNDLTATVGSNPAGGTLTLNSDGSFTYTATAGVTGPEAFTFVANDGVYNSGQTTVTIDVENSVLPSADLGSGYSYTLPPNMMFTVSAAAGVLSQAWDPYGDNLTAILVAGSGPSSGTLSLNPDGSFSYIPSNGFTGTDSFSVEVSDGLYTSLPTTVTLDVSPDAGNGTSDSDSGQDSGDVTDPTPQVEDDSYTIAPNQTLITPIGQGVLANDTDPGGLTLTAAPVPNEGVTHGTLNLQSDGLFTYTPTANYIGPDSFTYEASDGTYTSSTGHGVDHRDRGCAGRHG